LTDEDRLDIPFHSSFSALENRSGVPAVTSGEATLSMQQVQPTDNYEQAQLLPDPETQLEHLWQPSQVERLAIDSQATSKPRDYHEWLTLQALAEAEPSIQQLPILNKRRQILSIAIRFGWTRVRLPDEAGNPYLAPPPPQPAVVIHRYKAFPKGAIPPQPTQSSQQRQQQGRRQNVKPWRAGKSQRNPSTVDTPLKGEPTT